jgi:integrase
MATITQRKVNSLKPREKRYSIADNGLSVEVFPSGKISYYISLRHDGRRIKEKLGDHPVISVKEARAKVTAIQHDLQFPEANPEPTPGSDLTVGQFVTRHLYPWIDTHRTKPHKLKPVYERLVMQSCLRDVPLSKVDAKRINRWRAEQHSKGIKSSTMRNYMAQLRRVFSLAVQYEMLEVSPFKDIKLPRGDDRGQKLYLSEVEREILGDTIEEWAEVVRQSCMVPDPEDRRTGLPYVPWFVWTAMGTGLRRSELLQIRWRDINWPKKELVVRGEVTKSKRTRVIPLSDNTLDMLEEWQGLSLEQGPETPHDVTIFGLSPNAAPAGWKYLKEIVGLPNLTIHLLRHDYASRLVLRGAPLTVVQRLLGHSSLTITEVYLSVRNDDLRSAVALLEN